MPRAVRFDHYGGVDVLKVVEVERPVPGPGEALVRVKAAGINPGEVSIREGRMHERFPAVFPSGEGSDLAGVVEEVAEDVEQFAVGDEVIGFTNRRASHAELVIVEAEHLVPRPPGVSWEAAGGLCIAGTTAYAAVRAVALAQGDTVVVSGAAGGVGSLVVQLARHTGDSEDFRPQPRRAARGGVQRRPRSSIRALSSSRRGCGWPLSPRWARSRRTSSSSPRFSTRSAAVWRRALASSWANTGRMPRRCCRRSSR